ncbi:MAG: hypothetical protein ACPGVZ_15810 [Myxococcota bacterium]
MLLASLVLLLGTTTATALEVLGVESASTAQEGPSLTLPQYTVPVDGLLVVRIGTHGGASNSVRFNGEEMIHASSLEVTYLTTIAVEMFYLPVEAGEVGDIAVTWRRNGTDQRALVAATVAGASDLEIARVWTDGSPQGNGRIGPNVAEIQMNATGASALLSAFTAFGNGVPEITGPDHVLDDHPTVPESTFHEMKFQAGHVEAPGASAHTIGFRNTNALGFMDYAMIVASFTAVPEPGFALTLGAGVAGLAAFGRRHRPLR